MLEVRDLTKIYKTKNSTSVHALDGVSLRFPETGMVFLLGKSGSGKSTLLNVCGGLDNPTTGEIIVKGRSSKDFSQSDFDSYRNTFIGFIFQEYNILNEFSVEDNIALALELQGKPKDKAAISALLEEVDLTGYAKRKPNTLSGGQKQRIAIARALIKKPEIIMADEPTGALDSNTGKQVFDTLKKLSKTKLVIVVSHDRDFAEQYGDRIIELKDGKILSDVSKTHAESEKVSDNLKVIGDVLCIKRGSELNENDFDSIKKFLKKSESDVVIATDEKSVKTFKTAARITDDGQMEVFSETNEEATPKKQYTKEDSRFIRSKLPLRHAFKIGVSGLRNKPIRLFFTVFLCSVAFVLFGLLSTLNFYNSEATFRQTAQDADILLVKLEKQYEYTSVWYNYGEEQHSYEGWNFTKFTPEEVEDIMQNMNSDAFGAVEYGGSFNLRQAQGSYWMNQINAVAYIPQGNSLHNKIEGEYPKNKNEIALSSYFADMLVTCGAYDSTGTAIELNDRNSLIGKSISIGGRDFKITGILDTGAIPPEFDVLKEASDDYSLQYKLLSLLNSSLHATVFVSEQQIAEYANEHSYYKEGRENYMRIAIGFKDDGEYKISEYGDMLYNGVSALSSQKKLYAISKDSTALADDEILIPSGYFFQYLAEEFSKIGRSYDEKDGSEMSQKYYLLESKCWELISGGTYEIRQSEDGKEESVLIPFTDVQYETLVAEIIKAAKEANIDMTLGIRCFDNQNYVYTGETQAFKIAGIYRENNDYYEQTYYVNDKIADALWEEQRKFIPDCYESISDYVESADALYTQICLPGNVPADKIDTYWEVYNNDEFGDDASRIVMRGGFVDSLRQVDYFVNDLSKVFLYVGLVLAVFAALLLSNFISVSISNKKREIGILRAVGARSVDVFKIFFSESFVIGLICVVISCGVSKWLCNMINTEYGADLGASIFVFGIASILVLIAIAAVTILIATFLPVYNAAKKKPVDSIRSL